MSDYFKPMTRQAAKRSEPAPIVAYDFETTRIPIKPTDPLTVKPLFLTTHTETWNDAFDPKGSYKATREYFGDYLWALLEPNTLLSAYNANRFDLRVLLEALLDSRFTVEPFISKVSGLRGAIVRYGRKRIKLVDPIAMLGMQCDLREFVATFAPEYPKGRINFDRVNFDPSNPRHVRYAKRDSEALYHALRRAQSVVRGICKDQELRPTVGALAINAFMQAMPRGVMVPALRPRSFEIVRRIVMRGGFVYSRPFTGALWTYDLNQAYAFAMRECSLPSGFARPVRSFCTDRPGFYRVKLSRSTRSPVPYMVRACQKPYRMLETSGEGCVTWLTTDEVNLLLHHGWNVTIIEGYAFEGSFHMTRWVNGLEARRAEFPKTHPVNVICKYVGCNAYGKTLQEPTTMRIVLSRKPPKGAWPMVAHDEQGDPIDGLWMVPERRDTRRRYERPQIGAFITAFVRCVVYDAIMADPEHFIKADTDSVSFTRKQPQLPLDKDRYGAWKLEADGEFHIVVAKKVYWSANKKAAKGMNVDKLRKRDFVAWFKGRVPLQHQRQLQSFKKRLAPTWTFRDRHGTGVLTEDPTAG